MPDPKPDIGAPSQIDVTELSSRVGQVLGRSSWRHVTQHEVDAFADLTGDDQWIHVDPGRATKGPFGTTIAHGYFTLSLATRIIDEVAAVTGADLVLNYGANRVRFPAPLPVGASLRAAVEVAAVDQVQGGQQVTWRLAYEVEGAAKPVCVADILYRYYPSFPTGPGQANGG